jgi:hypothetical protein
MAHRAEDKPQLVKWPRGVSLALPCRRFTIPFTGCRVSNSFVGSATAYVTDVTQRPDRRDELSRRCVQLRGAVPNLPEVTIK